MCSVIPVGETQPKGDGGTWQNHSGPPDTASNSTPRPSPFLSSPASPTATRAQGGRLSPRPSADQEEPPSDRRAKARWGQTVNKPPTGHLSGRESGSERPPPTAFTWAIIGIFYGCVLVS